MAMDAMAMPMPPPTSPELLAATFVMWFVMMVAMMLPSAAPMILLYARFARQARAQGGALLPTGLFAGTYVALWAAFSAVAAGVQALLVESGVVGQATLRVGDARLAGVLLIAAGLYQLTPLKRACLDRCRSPFAFLMREWGAGWRRALRLGARHGLFCIGCCWLLMALLFVGGVMNLAWVAALALIVLIEKVAPSPRLTGGLVAAAAIIGGLWLLADPGALRG
jgi:predicted metal-binding membrane protein